MLRSLREISGCVITAEDGEVGRCRDFLIDDRMWVVRYMVANTAKWLPGRKVLVAPDFLARPDWPAGRLPIRLTRDQVATCPELDERSPVPRLYEAWYREHHSMPYYWAANDMGGALSATWGTTHPIPLPDRSVSPSPLPPENEIHLRSVHELAGFRVVARGGVAGRAADFLLDDETWALRYIVVEMRKLLLRREILVSPQWLDSVSYAPGEFQVGLTLEAIRGSRAYDASRPVDRAYEASLYDRYDRPYYWEQQ